MQTTSIVLRALGLPRLSEPGAARRVPSNGDIYRTELDYETLSISGKKIVDTVYRVRDSCVNG